MGVVGQHQEVLGLRWSEVDWDAGEVRLSAERSKNHTARTFPFRALPELEKLLEAQREATRGVHRAFQRLNVTHVSIDSVAQEERVRTLAQLDSQVIPLRRIDEG